jgi:HK97 family phage portal protein
MIGGSLFSWLGRTIGLGPSSNRFWAAWSGKETSSGENTSPDRCMTLSAFNRGIRLWAETVATLPLDVYKIGTDGRGKLVTDPADQYRTVLKTSPNQDQTPTEFWEGLIGCMFLTGDGLARKVKLGDRLVAQTLMDPTRTAVIRDPVTFALKYRYTDPRGKIVELAADEVFHLKGFGFGGDRGMSIVQYGAQTFGSSLAADKVAAKMFKSGLSSSGFIETGQTINETDRPRLEQVLAEYQGSENAGKLMILEAGMKYTAVSISAADAQLLASRGFNIEEVARWLGLPPVLLGHSGAGTTMWGTGVEQIIQAWYTLGLRALLHRIEQAIQKRVIAPADQARYYVKFNVEGLLRGDSAARANLYSVFVQNGIMTRAEVRELEDLEPYEGKGADKLTAQVNLTTLEHIGEGADAGTKGGPPGPTPASGKAVAMFKAYLGIDDAVTVQDLFDIRREISNLRRRQDIAESTVIDQPAPPRLAKPQPAPQPDLRDR